MLARYEKRTYSGNTKVWIGRYRNLHNIPHWHSDHEVLSCEKGRCRLHIGNNEYIIEEGDGVFVSGGTIHAIDSDPGTILAVCLFDPSLDQGIPASRSLVSPVYKDNFGIRTILDNILRDYTARPPFYEASNAAEASLAVSLIFRNLPSTKTGKETKSSPDPYRELLMWMEENYRDADFEQAAAHTGFSPAYFSRYFKNMSGMTFSRYRSFLRIEKALGLLREHPDLPMTEIMRSTGFGTIRSFNRSFKEITGYSPGSLPENYQLMIRSDQSRYIFFDPTLESSELLEES